MEQEKTLINQIISAKRRANGFTNIYSLFVTSDTNRSLGMSKQRALSPSSRGHQAQRGSRKPFLSAAAVAQREMLQRTMIDPIGGAPRCPQARHFALPLFVRASIARLISRGMINKLTLRRIWKRRKEKARAISIRGERQVVCFHIRDRSKSIYIE